MKHIYLLKYPRAAKKICRVLVALFLLHSAGASAACEQEQWRASLSHSLYGMTNGAKAEAQKCMERELERKRTEQMWRDLEAANTQRRIDDAVKAALAKRAREDAAKAAAEAATAPAD